MTKSINIEVVYALPEKQKIVKLKLPEGTKAIEAVAASQLSQVFNEIDETDIKLGIYSQHIENEQILKEGDRVEIYRPLVADPKEIRKRRAAEMAQKKKFQKQKNA